MDVKMENKIITRIKENNENMSNLELTMLGILENNIEDLSEQETLHYMENEAICSTGAVSGLIYYSETDEIFKGNFEEIFDLYNDIAEELGTDSMSFELNANNLVWFAFEQLVYNWFNELEN